MMLFTHNIEKIKGAAHRDGEIDDKCRRGFTDEKRSCLVAGYFLEYVTE